MATAPGTSETPRVAVARPQRASSRRKFDALIAAARDVFADDGVNGSLEEIARRAGVGIGTLYRNFPTRQALLEAVYVDEVEALARVADELGDLDPWETLATWLRQFVVYATTKRAVVEGLNLDSPLFGACIALIHRAGEPLLKAAQDAGKARSDVGFEDVRLLINGIASSNFAGDAQRERVLGMALDGIKTRS
ncbi:TetR/AcrR family transcriptional regulator [Streptomyces sp. SBT349]|uniref:TetR/AcrR family transcriptional regulator n=1 Tax=Streptomyces sp. SBT349 TaxID=1580539 RepID=UPI00066E7B50|nr:TetR/AcrR family transcriptional regulator [Streptomyces sp. SBT349]